MTLLEFNALTLITQSLHVREVINGALFVLCSNLAIMLFYLMARMRLLIGKGWTQEDGMASICVLAWIFGIVGLRSGLVWWSLRIANDGYAFSQSLEMFSNWVLIVSAVIFAMITLRATYLWSPLRWHHKAWIVSGLVASVFLALSEYL